VLGFLNRHNAVHASLFEASLHPGVVLAGFDAFCHTRTTKPVVVIDQASIHTRAALADRLPSWKKPGLIIKYLRPSSPE